MPRPSDSMAFAGFPAGSFKGTVFPNLFFSVVLPEIDSLAELKLILAVFWRLQEKKGYPQYVTLSEMVAEGIRLGVIEPGNQEPERATRDLLQSAVERGVLLHLLARFPNRMEDIYFVNSVQGRKAVQQLRQGELDIGQELVEKPEAKTAVERKDVFTLYEQNIGLLTPLIAEQLQEAEQLYPAEWVEEAFRLAVEYNKRSWRYIRSILERWAQEGRRDRRYLK
ncbi:MAG: DnaD domain-containing protein [Chloroflexota bacterium]